MSTGMLSSGFVTTTGGMRVDVESVGAWKLTHVPAAVRQSNVAHNRETTTTLELLLACSSSARVNTS